MQNLPIVTRNHKNNYKLIISIQRKFGSANYVSPDIASMFKIRFCCIAISISICS